MYEEDTPPSQEKKKLPTHPLSISSYSSYSSSSSTPQIMNINNYNRQNIHLNQKTKKERN